MPVFWYAQKKKQRRKILLSCTAFHHLLCMKFVHKIKGTWWSMLISVKQGILIHIIEAWWHGVYVEQVGIQISQWIKKTPKNLDFSGFVVFSFVSSLDRKIRLENWVPCKTRLFQRFVCYKCVTKEHTILFCKSLFIFFQMIPHLIRPPRHVYIIPPP